MNSNALPARIHGIVAALLVPRVEGGAVDWAAFERNLQAVASSGVHGLSVGGATGEYLSCTLEERRALMRVTAAAAASAGLVFMPAIGSALFCESVALAGCAAELDAHAVLLPPPPLFRYSQEDLIAFYTEATARSPVPVLLYNLPAFLTPIEADSAQFLLKGGVAGIKDSGRSPALLASLRAALGARALLLVGNDAALEEALRLGACDGCVSGVAGVIPELLIALFSESSRANAARLLGEYLERCDAFPAPWGLKLTAELRGWGSAALPFPLSAARARQVEAFREWFPPWWERAGRFPLAGGANSE